MKECCIPSARFFDLPERGYCWRTLLYGSSAPAALRKLVLRGWLGGSRPPLNHPLKTTSEPCSGERSKQSMAEGKVIGSRERDGFGNRAEEVGFEPTRASSARHDVQSCSLDHYETPPGKAERVGFEPTRTFQPYRFSRAAHSTTLTSLRGGV